MRKRSRLEYGPERPAFLLLGALFALAVAGCGQPPLRAWTEAAARMTRGESAGKENSSQFMPPDDTGEALGLSPARMTLTFGFGPSFFEKDGENRFGLAGRRPEALAPLSPLTGDMLDEGDQTVTCACKRARTTRRWRSTRCGTW